MVQDPVLVTGAGFIGFCLARQLLENGRAVVGVDSVNAYYDPTLKEARLAAFCGSFRILVFIESISPIALPRKPCSGRQFWTGGAPRSASRRAVLAAKSSRLSGCQSLRLPQRSGRLPSPQDRAPRLCVIEFRLRRQHAAAVFSA